MIKIKPYKGRHGIHWCTNQRRGANWVPQESKGSSSQMPMIINDLPPEILSEIFLLSYDDNCTIPIGKQRYVRAMHRRWVPFSLIHVCQYWRETALSLHSLWTHLCGDSSTPAAIEQWLKFSYPAHLHLTLSAATRGDAELDVPLVARAKQMLQLYARNSDRWGSLSFGTSHPEIAQEFVNIIRGTSSSSPIRSMRIHLPKKATSPMMIDSLMSSIPPYHSLNDLCWAVPSGGMPLPQIFPWHTLEDVFLMATFQLDDVIWCLAHCVSATKITLAATASPGQDRLTTSKHNHSTLPNLKSLTLNDGCNPWMILQYFTLPSLCSLELFTLQVFPPLLEEFLDRWQCPLIHVTIGVRWNRIVTDADVIGCLLIPYLRTVDIVKVSAQYAGERLPDIIEQQPDILLKLSRLRVVDTSYIGWQTGSYKVQRKFYY